MRITPVICWDCQNWFLPKSKRKNKFCCNACRQQWYLKGHKEPNLSFNYKGMPQVQEHLEHYDFNLAVWMDKDYSNYCLMVFKWGKDIYGKSAEEWLQNQQPLEGA